MAAPWDHKYRFEVYKLTPWRFKEHWPPDGLYVPPMTDYITPSNMELDFGITNKTYSEASQYSYTSQILDILQLFRTTSGQWGQECKRAQQKTLANFTFFCPLCYNNCTYLACESGKPSRVSLITSSSGCSGSQATPENRHCPLLASPVWRIPAFQNLFMPDAQQKSALGTHQWSLLEQICSVMSLSKAA